MCGRYSESADLKTLKERFGFAAPPLDLKPRCDIAPTQEAPVVVLEGGKRLRLFRWGLIPSWAKDPAIGSRMINARAETLLERPSFKRPFQRTRCLVVADGFYEWRREPGGRTPMRIVLESREPFAMAGLWDAWEDPAGRAVRSFAIVTTSANGTLKPIHDRMPVVLERSAEDGWLDPESPPERLAAMLKPSSERMEVCEISRLAPDGRTGLPAPPPELLL